MPKITSENSTSRTTIRVDEEILKSYAALAESDGCSVNQEINNALKYYRDFRYMNDTATFINEDILRLIDSRISLAEQRINNKTNQVLSSSAIELCVVAQILADQLDVDVSQLETYRRSAAQFIKMNNRAFRLDELL